MRRSISLERSGESRDSSSFEHVKDSVIHGLQEELILHKEKAISLMDEIKSSVKDPLTSSLISLYNKEMEHVFELSTNIDTMYEKELKFLMQQEKLLSASGKSSLLEEFQKLEDVVNLGIRSGKNNAEMNVTNLLFENIKVDFEENCPLLTDILHVLFPKTKRTEKKEKGAIHSLALLASLRNKQCRNDVTLIFSLMLVSYGAGSRMVNMLNKIGLSVHWDTLMNFFDQQLETKNAYVKSLTPEEVPLLLLMDNINIYHGNKCHHRLFKMYGANMWNITVRGLLIPEIDGIGHLFSCKETATQSQQDVTKFDYENITIEKNEEHMKIWKTHKDGYLVQLFNYACPWELLSH